MSGASARKRLGWNSPHLAILGFVILVEIYFFASYHEERWRKALRPIQQEQVQQGEGLVIRCDGLGYYAWLRSLLIDGDWSFDNEFDGHNVLGDFVPAPNQRTELDRRANLWSLGPACIWSVVVIPGHAMVSLLREWGGPWAADGYSLPYQLMVGSATLLVSFLGFAWIYLIGRSFVDPAPAALAAAFLTLGSPILYYSTIEGSMAHGVGTAATAGLVWFWLKTYGSSSWRRWFWVGTGVGAVTLIRWQLATLAILPIGEAVLTWLPARDFTCRRWGRLALAGAGGWLAFLPQMLAWRCLFGHWLVQPFPTAHNWYQPSFWQVLLSQERGLFFWTPIALLGCLGLVGWFKHRRWHPNAALLAAAFLLQVYVVASLWGQEVYLGAAFGFRHLTECLVLLAPGLAFLLSRGSPGRIRAFTMVGGVLVLWNLLLLAQYRYGYIPADRGADLPTLLAQTIRLMQRKHFGLAWQLAAAPILLLMALHDFGEARFLASRGR
jgi:hypothetical protein